MKLIDKAAHPENCPSCGKDVSPRPHQSEGGKKRKSIFCLALILRQFVKWF